MQGASACFVSQLLLSLGTTEYKDIQTRQQHWAQSIAK
jgi:hypothetical protein